MKKILLVVFLFSLLQSCDKSPEKSLNDFCGQEIVGKSMHDGYCWLHFKNDSVPQVIQIKVDESTYDYYYERNLFYADHSKEDGFARNHTRVECKKLD